MFIKEEYSTIEYVCFYQITIVDDVDVNFLIGELPQWFQIIYFNGKPLITVKGDKVIFGIHSEYKNDVDYDFVNESIYSMFGANENALTDDSYLFIEQIPCPTKYKEYKYYLVDAEEFIDKEEAEEYWNNSFIGWEDADTNFPTTFRKFIKQSTENGFLRIVEFIR